MGRWVHRVLSYDAVNLTVDCANCGVVRARVMQGRPKCSVGAREQHGPSSGSKPKWYYDKGPHGLTIPQAREYREGRVCQICGSDKSLVVDHNHTTGEIRGVLCRTCNAGLGMFMDSRDLLESAQRYLEDTENPLEDGPV